VHCDVELPFDDTDSWNVAIVIAVGKEIGAGPLTRDQLALYRERHLGRFRAALEHRTDIRDPARAARFAVYSSYCKNEELDHLVNVLRWTLCEPHYAVEEVTTQLLRLQRETTQGLNGRASTLARLMAGSRLSPEWAMDDAARGLTFARELMRIVQGGEFEKYAATLAGIIENVVRKGHMRIAVHVSGEEQQRTAVEKLGEFVRVFNGDRPRGPFPVPARPQDAAAARRVFLDAKASSNCSAEARRIGSFLDPESPVLSCLARVLEADFLQNLIRVELGAYGAFAQYDSAAGVFTLESYRDRNTTGVLAAFAKALRLAAEGEGITESVVENTVITRFSALDRPEPPQERGLVVWRGKPIEVLRRRRHIYYNLTKQQLVDAAKAVVAIEPVTVVYSSQSLSPAPEGFTVIDLSKLFNQPEEEAPEADEDE
jgi:Zn-dependent M16 (insulinase) family peptidase